MNNKELVINFSKRLWEKQDLNAIDEMFTTDAKIHSPLCTKKGQSTMREIAEKWLTAFPDLVIKWDEFIAENDKVVCRWRATGTHMGSLFETSPTHQEVSWSGITIYTVDNDKITEYRALVDMHAILTQLFQYESISEVVD